MKIRRVRDIRRKDVLSDASKLCLENSERFIKDAELLVEESSYGHAQSLAILAMEEISKAVIYYFAAEGIFPTEHIKEVELLRHKSKHIAFVGTQAAVDFLLTRKENLEKIGRMPTYPEAKKMLLPVIKKALSLVQEARQMEPDRIRGFYVDVIGKKEISSPKHVSRENSEKYISRAKSLHAKTKVVVNSQFPHVAKANYKALFEEFFKRLPEIEGKTKEKES